MSRFKLCGMIALSLILSSDEWILVQRAAARQWPGETLSRSEIIRRYVLVGIAALRIAPAAEIARMAHELQASMLASDERLRT